MNYFFILPLWIISLSLSTTDDASDFESDLNQIARDFKTNIMDESQCRQLEDDAEDLSEDIQDEIDNGSEEKMKLEQLKKEADALVVYMNCIGLAGSNIPTVEQFEMANRRVGGVVTFGASGNYCVVIQKVTINAYVCYIMRNNSSNNFTVSYKWKNTNGMRTGYGDQGVPKGCVREFYNNRDNPEDKSISVYAIACKTF
jgi:hypothetical protein